MKPLIVPLFSNPENNGLYSVYSLHFLLSTNLYLKDRTRHEHINFLKKNITSSARKPGINHTKRKTPFKPLNDLKPLNCNPRFRITVQNAQNTYSAYLQFFKTI